MNERFFFIVLYSADTWKVMERKKAGMVKALYSYNITGMKQAVSYTGK